MWWPFSKVGGLSRRIAILEGKTKLAEGQQFFTAVGAFTICWAGLEIALDASNAFFLRDVGADQIQSDLPVSLRPKIRFYRQAHTRLAPLEPYRDAGTGLADRVTALSGTRHDMIHGFVMSSETDGSRSILRLGYEGPSLTPSYQTYSPQEIVSVAETTADLAAEIMDHLFAISRALAPEKSVNN